MDPIVKQALARWPNVPAVYGWLSLDERGRWQIHEQGDACDGGPGESITSPQILGFINRNYACDEQGRWFFQNGPQRVYVRLDAAPYILRVADTDANLITHTGKAVSRIDGWWLDEDGRVYAQTDLGGGLVDSHDVERVLSDIKIAVDGSALFDVLADDSTQLANAQLHYAHYREPALWHGEVARATLPDVLGFVANPRPT
ncbi:DUF2946 family protein [Bordetella sp. 02P26C-1]|uniref:DUF2946 family protein n=1 Tax=Bordetella sp. 02P26C-1 TaxID=2683195 RepID=UPI0013540B7F|nr:DUF2946 family protein [Bordetella sp. 02P26C-1]MVW77461.1 DUF2946 family protein [Bordetella sp. 02P26C-1]